MGFFRGGTIFFLGVLLLISLFVGNLFFVLYSSLDYKNVQEHFTPILSNVIYGGMDEQQINEAFDMMINYCQQKDNFPIDSGVFIFDIPCSSILSQTPQQVLILEVESFINKVYYNEYECSFFDCFSQQNLPFFLISKNTQDYVKSKFYFFLVLSLILTGLIFLLLQHKKSILIVLGSLIILSSLPLIKIGSLSTILSGEHIPEVLSLFTGKATTTFWVVFVLGIILICLGIGLRFWNYEKIKEFFSKIKNKKK